VRKESMINMKNFGFIDYVKSMENTRNLDIERFSDIRDVEDVIFDRVFNMHKKASELTEKY